MKLIKYKKIYTLLIIIILISLYLLFNIINRNKLYKDDMNSMFHEQWALYNIGQEIKGIRGIRKLDINAVRAWNITKGTSNVIVGILDTGIELNNSEICHSIYTNESEIPNNNIDDDNNGYVDDVNGWNFYDDSNIIYEDYLSDYHGTYIAGIISSNHNNGYICGISPNIKILPLKFMRNSSGSIKDAIKAIDYAYNIGARIINCSWDSTVLDEELKNTMLKYSDVLFVCSAGKHQQDLSKIPVYPASFELENVITVGAINNKGKLYKFSGFGDEIDVLAPGENVLSILPEGEFIYSNGTSVATAYVSGIAALIKSYSADLTASEIATILESSSKKVGNIEIIDAYKCLLKAKEYTREMNKL